MRSCVGRLQYDLLISARTMGLVTAFRILIIIFSCEGV